MAAQPQQQVDPSTLQPALNPDFDWSCQKTGRNTICKGTFEPSYHEPIGVFCDGQEVWIQGAGREFTTRWHSAHGRRLPVGSPVVVVDCGWAVNGRDTGRNRRGADALHESSTSPGSPPRKGRPS